jgi:hypothetical protein
MLHIERHTVEEPSVLRSPEIERERARARAYYETPERARHQRRFEPNWKLDYSPGLLQALQQLFHGKCAYCESQLADWEGELDRYRPWGRAVGLDGVVASDHYWWLPYEWSNLYLVCATCNRLKASRFPVKGQRAKIGARSDALLAEAPLLLDPCIDYPNQHLTFTEQGLVVSETERGLATIDILGLNRQDLIIQRHDDLRKVLDLLQQAAVMIQTSGPQDELRRVFDLLASELEPTRPYTCMRRQYIYRWLTEQGLGETAIAEEMFSVVLRRPRLVTEGDEERGLTEYNRHLAKQEVYSVEGDEAPHKEAYYASAKRVERIVIHNFKAIQDLDLSFPTPQTSSEAWLMLLGENGTGKSSILQALALALMGEKHVNELGLKPGDLVNRNRSHTGGHVKLYLTGLSTPIELSFRRGSPRFEVFPKDPKMLLLGYGSTRLLPRPGLGSGAPSASKISSTLLRPSMMWKPGLWTSAVCRVASSTLSLRHLKTCSC